MKENKEETKLQSEQKTAEIFFDKVDVSNMLSMVCDQFNASSQGREDFIKKVINDYTAHRIHASQFKSQLPIEQKNELELIIAEEERAFMIQLMKHCVTSRLSYIFDENREGLHLSDRLSPDEDTTVTLGLQEIEYLTEHIVEAIKDLPIEGVEREQLREAFEAGQNSDDYDQWVKHNYDFDEWLATRKGSKSGE